MTFFCFSFYCYSVCSGTKIKNNFEIFFAGIPRSVISDTSMSESFDFAASWDSLLQKYRVQFFHQGLSRQRCTWGLFGKNFASVFWQAEPAKTAINIHRSRFSNWLFSSRTSLNFRKLQVFEVCLSVFTSFSGFVPGILASNFQSYLLPTTSSISIALPASSFEFEE